MVSRININDRKEINGQCVLAAVRKRIFQRIVQFVHDNPARIAQINGQQYAAGITRGVPEH
jgi:hypothetical protein